MPQYCDLHTHSTYSDGTYSPAEIISEAEKLGLSAVALTDHNTVAGIPDFMAAARGSSVEAIPGVEVSCQYGDIELHLVGLFLPPENLDIVTVYLESLNRKKEESNRQMIQRLNQAGYALDYDEIRQSHPDGTVNRAVIASSMLEKGYVSSVEEAFQGLLSQKAGFYVPPQRLSFANAIALIRYVEAVPVLAHPFLNLKTKEKLRTCLVEAVPNGLMGMETLYSSYSPETQAAAQRIAREFGLLESGGSDFHGQTKPHISLGVGKGNLAVPASFADTLKNSI
jgi:predicted metal-dependent phosphoesterase TrpH